MTLLTPHGVVTVKCVAEQYSQYDKQISKPNKETGKKEVIERSWFKRGTRLVVTGGGRMTNSWPVADRVKTNTHFIKS